jgi:hypothetical protein
MVLSGLLVIFPLADEIAPEIVPETAKIAKAGDPLPPGPMPGGYDGKAVDGHDVLVILDYIYYGARHNNPSYALGYDSYYGRIAGLTDYFHYLGVTVDFWYCYPYNYGSLGQTWTGTYDGLTYHSYYPVDSNGYKDCIPSYDDYGMVIHIHLVRVLLGKLQLQRELRDRPARDL